MLQCDGEFCSSETDVCQSETPVNTPASGYRNSAGIGEYFHAKFINPSGRHLWLLAARSMSLVKFFVAKLSCATLWGSEMFRITSIQKSNSADVEI